MTPRNNDRVKELFDTTTLELPTPSFADRVLYVPFSSDRQVTFGCARVLSDFELQRADSFLTDRGLAHFIQRRSFRRYCGAIASGWPAGVSQIAFEETENGRPWLRDRPDLWFSFSSCRSGFIGAWSSTHAIGVDVEDQTIDVETAELAQMYFTESEALAIDKKKSHRLRTFFQLWCLKEAALKSIGEGLPFGLDTFEFTLDGDLRIINAPETHGGPDGFSAYLLDQTDVCVALVARNLDGQKSQYPIHTRHSYAA